MPEPAADRPASILPPSRGPRAAPPRRGSPWIWLAVVAIVAAIAALWLDARKAERELKSEIAQRLAAIDAGEQASRTAVKDLQENLRDAQAKIALLENRLGESQTQQAALEALYRELSPTRDEWALTEVEQVLMLASQQLQLAGNVRGALAALQVADTKLQRLDRPQFVPLRRALARDMDRLKAVPYVDVAGLSLRLDQAIAAIDTLPLALEQRIEATPAQAPESESGWRGLLRGAWRQFRQLVRIENIERPEVPLLAPHEQFFLRENVKLRLLSARFALLFRDQANFRADLDAALDWVGKYFDTRSKPVQTLQTLLKQLKATDMTTELPGLAASLDAVRVLQLARDKPPR
ncbi:MAG TPA: uroporphyrinogen-III C-methyltransferase [Casimicrobiaceae bacterium]|nr:uroporphyrinogen-III C-methyltransferase [Casimicrobiaceae bacterium]